jgi:ABC-2 type transport system permease protein
LKEGAARVAELQQQPRTIGGRFRVWLASERRKVTGGSPAARVYQLNRRRPVLRMLIARDLKKRYENSYLGYLWTFLEPAMLLGIYYVVFKHLARFSQPDYMLFMATAMMPWLWFRSTVRGASSVIAKNSKLVSSINLPREIYPLSLALTEGIEYLLTLPLVGIIAIIYGHGLTHYVVFVPFAMVLMLILVTGMALLMSALTTLFKDIDRLLSSVLRVMFYLTPVIYPTGRLDQYEIARKIFVLDPLVGIMEIHRKAFYPETEITSTMLTVSIAGSLLIFVVGWAVFIKLERAVLKEL